MRHALPIVAKELVQLAARKQTYAWRILYLLLTTFFFFQSYQVFRSFSGASFLQQMGRGVWIFNGLYYIQLFLVIFAVPPLVASAITSEKESGTVELLLTLPLSERSILLQKLCARLTPVIGLIFLGMPLFAYSYTLGGVTPRMIFIGTAYTLIAAIGTGIVALGISVHHKSSASAIISTYLTLLIPVGFYSAIANPDTMYNYFTLIGLSIATAFVSWIILAVAQVVFRPRALNQLLPGYDRRPELIPKRNVHVATYGLPPEAHPIRWLEHIKSSFSYTQAFVSSACYGMFVLLFAMSSPESYYLTLFPAMLALGVAVFFRYQRAALQFRQNQLLPTLLTTPIPHPAVIKEFMRGRMFVQHQSMIVVCTLCALAALGAFEPASLIICIGIVLAAWFYLRTLAWFATGISFFSRTTLQAIGYGLGIVLLMVFALPNILPAPEIWNPTYFAFEIMNSQYGYDAEWGLDPKNLRAFRIILLHLTCCAVVLFTVRSTVIRIAPRLLLRAANKH